MRLRQGEAASLGEVFTFMSGLYFRGKLTYARAFSPREPLVIAPGRGLLPASTPMTLEELRTMAAIPVDADEPQYCEPLRRDAELLCAELDGHVAVLLGSLGTDKYLRILSRCLGDRLRVPKSFFGRGDMSRGALLLRCARRRRELVYVPAPVSAGSRRA